MDVKEFLPYLKLMDRGYKYTRDNSPMHKWYLNGTDDILTIETKNTLDLICLGTQGTAREWFYNFQFFSTEWLSMGRVHRGFAKNVEELLGGQHDKDSLISHCKRACGEGKKITIVGHSRGYPIACLVSTYLVYHGMRDCIHKVVGCGGARIGDRKFTETYSSMLGKRTFVLNAYNDPVTYAPIWGGVHGQVIKIRLGIGMFPKHLLKHYINASLNEV